MKPAGRQRPALAWGSYTEPSNELVRCLVCGVKLLAHAGQVSGHLARTHQLNAKGRNDTGSYIEAVASQRAPAA